MGFNKRLVSKETVQNSFKNKQSLSELFKADAVIFMDSIASKVYSLHKEGYSDKEINEHINEELRND
jgi:hypothetical protein